MNIKRKFLTPEEVAKAFGRSMDAVYKSIKKEEIPAVKLGRRFYIPISFVKGDQVQTISD